MPEILLSPREMVQQPTVPQRQSQVQSPQVQSPQVQAPQVQSPQVQSPRVQSPRVQSPQHLSMSREQQYIQNLENQITLQQQLLDLQQQGRQLQQRPVPLWESPATKRVHLSPLSSSTIISSPESELATPLPPRDVNKLEIFMFLNVRIRLRIKQKIQIFSFKVVIR